MGMGRKLFNSCFECLPSLVEVDEKDNIISETCQPMSCWHGDYESKYVIYERVEGLKRKIIKDLCEKV